MRRRETPLRPDPLANILEGKRQADERRKELVLRLKLASALSTSRSSDRDKLPSQDANSNIPPAVETAQNIEISGEDPNSDAPLRELTVDRLIDSAGTSVRLHNCFTNHRELFRQFTVSQVLLDRDKFFSTLIRCQNLGRKTANEVLSLVDLYRDKPWPIAGHIDREQPENDLEPVTQSQAARGLPQAILDEHITAILRNFDTTTRLGN